MGQVGLPELRFFGDVRRHILGPVMIPSRFDLHGDGATPNEVMYSCHYYNTHHFGESDINHVLDVDCVRIVESYILETESIINGQTYIEGTWMAKAEVDFTNTGDVIWEMLLSGELEGFSPNGTMFENKVVIQT